MNDQNYSAHPVLGALALSGGAALFGTILLDATYGLPWAMPPSWYTMRPLWGALALAACAAGLYWQRSRVTRVSEWRPAIPGRRFHRLVVYSRSDCHLCDDAKAVLAQYLEFLPVIEAVDIDADPELKDRFGTIVPVVEVDGQVRFHGRVDEVLLRRLIEGTPPG